MIAPIFYLLAFKRSLLMYKYDVLTFIVIKFLASIGKFILIYKKIFIFLTIIITIATCIILNNSNNSPKETTTYIVKPGDTLWDIVAEYSDENTNIMEEIHKIKKQNNLSGYLKVGQKLIIEKN